MADRFSELFEGEDQLGPAVMVLVGHLAHIFQSTASLSRRTLEAPPWEAVRALIDLAPAYVRTYVPTPVRNPKCQAGLCDPCEGRVSQCRIGPQIDASRGRRLTSSWATPQPDSRTAQRRGVGGIATPRPAYSLLPPTSKVVQDPVEVSSGVGVHPIRREVAREGMGQQVPVAGQLRPGLDTGG